MRAWRFHDSCENRTAPLAWLLRITRNESLRVLARRIRDGERELTEMHEPYADDQRLDALVGRLDARTMLARLRPEERILVRLRYVDDLTHTEVARRLEVPEGTVKVRLHRIRNRLRTHMEVEQA